MYLVATQIRPGMIINLDNELFRVLVADHVTPGKGRGMIQTKLRNLKTGYGTEYRFRSDERVDKVILEQRKMGFLYKDGDTYHFMDSETYEQIELDKEIIGDARYFLVPNIIVATEFYEGRPVGFIPPKTVDLKIVSTEPALKGATITGSGKPATLETGLIIQVPQFISEGEMVRVDIESKKYVERVK